MNGRGRASVIALWLMIVACATSQPVADAWLERAKRLAAGVAMARSQVLEIAGGTYKAEAVRCSAAAMVVTGADGAQVTDVRKLYECMRPANEGRDRVEAAASAYAELARPILTAQSWPDVLLRIPQLRRAARELAGAVETFSGLDRAADASNILIAPLDAAERAERTGGV